MIDYRLQDLLSKGNQLIIKYDSGTITNNEIYSEKFSLEESICSNESLKFGGCEASSIRFTISNSGISLKNKWLQVTFFLKNQETEYNIGYFKVISDKLDANKKTREIVAYDKMYDIVNCEISKFYNGLLFPITVKSFREQLFEFLECEQRDVELPNDDELICATPLYDSLFGGDVLRDICEINGCFGKIGKDGIFDYVFLEQETSAEIKTQHYSPSNLKYEDFTTQKIDGITLTQGNAETDFFFNPNDGDNLYTIETRALYFGENEKNVNRILERIYDIIGGIEYVPFSVKCTGVVDRGCGQKIKIHTTAGEIDSYIFERSLSGIQSLRDSITTNGTEIYEKRQVSSSRAVYYANKQITDIYKNNFYSYTFTNALQYSFSSTREYIIEFNVAATSNTDVIFLATIPIELDMDGEIIIRYYVDAKEDTDSTLRQYLHQGMNAVTISNFLSMGENDRLTLLVSAETAYTESVQRKQEARITSIENYIQTGEYTETEIDQTIPTAQIRKWGIKAVLFAKGLAGTASWDGTLNFAETMGKIAIQQIDSKMTKASLDILYPEMNTSNIGIVIGKISLQQIGLVGFSESIGMEQMVTNYTFEPKKAKNYTFNADYVGVDESYHLQTAYKVTSIAVEIDNGSMCSLTLRTDDKATIESVVIESEL